MTGLTQNWYARPLVSIVRCNTTPILTSRPAGGSLKGFWDLVTQRNNEGTTIFLSSHVLSEVQHHCRHAAIIREGRIVVSDAVESLSRTTARRVTLRGVQELPALPPGVLETHHSQNEVGVLYSGDMKALMNSLQEVPFTDITITEPELEEIFFHFYEKAGART